MPIQTRTRRYFDQAMFALEFEGLDEVKFEKCSELKAVVDEIVRRQGGELLPDKSPGLVNIEALTLERGALVGNTDFLRWIESVVDMSIDRGVGGLPAEHKRDGQLVIFDRDGSTALRRFTIREAWPKEFSMGPWDATASGHVMERLVLSIKSFSLVEGSQ